MVTVTFADGLVANRNMLKILPDMRLLILSVFAAAMMAELGDVNQHARAVMTLAGLHARQGRYDTARDMLENDDDLKVQKGSQTVTMTPTWY